MDSLASLSRHENSADSSNNNTDMVIKVVSFPQDNYHRQSPQAQHEPPPQNIQPHDDEEEEYDGSREEERFSDVSSLEFSAPEDASHSLYGLPSPQQQQHDDLIGHHLNRSAQIMSANRKREAALSSRRRLAASHVHEYSPYYYNRRPQVLSPPSPFSRGTHHMAAREQSVVQMANSVQVEQANLVVHDVVPAATVSNKSSVMEENPSLQDNDLDKETDMSLESPSNQEEYPQEEEEDIDLEQPSPTSSASQRDNGNLDGIDHADHAITSAVLLSSSSSSSHNDKNDEPSSSSHTRDSSSSFDNNDSNDNNGTYRNEASEDSKYDSYALLVDPNQGDRAVEIELYSFARPHMRAFHLAWMSFFVAFFTWFAITPLLSEVARSLSLNRRQVWNSSTLAVAGSAVTRILIGPINDKYGARWVMSLTLVLSAIPTALLGLVNSAMGLYMMRLVIGVAGSTFVTCQYWTSSFFTWEVAGTANALVAGWGNLGGGVTQVVMGTLLFPLFKIFYGGSFGRAKELEDDDNVTANEEVDRASDLAWRTVCIIPAVLCFAMAMAVVRCSDDSPKGNYGKRRREGLQPNVSASQSLWRGLGNTNTWILLVQYGCCFGVEITMVNAAALYFKDEFGQTTETAAAIASIFGWMNLFARGVGGFCSDMANAKWGMRGRLVVQTVTLLLEGVTVIGFSETDTLGGAIAVMVVFSVFVQAAEGSTYGIVPYVNPVVTGAIAGVVGAGGNVGGVGFSLLFRENAYRRAFKTMGYVVMGSALFTPFIRIQGHRSLLFGTDAPQVRERRVNHSQQMGNTPSLLVVDESTRRTSRHGSTRHGSQLRSSVQTPTEESPKEPCPAV